MKKTGSRHILFIVFLIFGIVVAVQAKSTLLAKKVSASNKLSVEMLKEQLAREKTAIEELRAAIDENLAMRNEIIREYVEQQDDVRLREEWELIRVHTGLVDVKGPGIVIELDDAPEMQPDADPGWFIVHDQQIKTILNDLKIAGAQAIAINGERIVPMSDQVCAGPTILINDNRYSVPYIIEAIGNPDELYEMMMNSRTIAEMMLFDIRIEIKKAKEIKLPKFSGSDKLDRYISALEVVEK
ncbi:MAG: DUF881 domain-containing protein [Acetivibrionales bacterium]|jgi:uncharacterized protein YlxW (UPF0749 family)